MLLLKMLKKSAVFVSILTMFALSGCWPIPDPAPATPAVTTGDVTFYSITPGLSSIHVAIDGITNTDVIYSGSTVPTCGTVAINTSTKTGLTAGSHYWTATGAMTSGTGITWSAQTVNVTAGGCTLVRLTYGGV